MDKIYLFIFPFGIDWICTRELGRISHAVIFSDTFWLFAMEDETEQDVFVSPQFQYDEDDRKLAQSLVNESRYLGKRLSTDKRVPGRIGEEQFYQFWRDELKAPPFVLQTLREGYRFPFREKPPGSMAWNNRCLRLAKV